MASKLRIKQNMFSEFNETPQPKTSLVKYSIELNDLPIQTLPYRMLYLRLLGRPYTLLYVSRSVGRLESDWFFSHTIISVIMLSSIKKCNLLTI